MSTRSIPVEVVLGMIDQAEQKFALEAARAKPVGDHAAYYTHGVVVGMDTVRKNILESMKIEDAREREQVSNDTKPISAGGRTNVYG